MHNIKVKLGCQVIVFKNQTEHQDTKCVEAEGNGEWVSHFQLTGGSGVVS